MRCLTIIMMNNLYPVKKLTTINNAKAIFLIELKEKTFIDISFHIFDTIMDETRTTSWAKLIFPSLLMRIFRNKRCSNSSRPQPNAYTLGYQQVNHHTDTSTTSGWCRWRRSWTRRRWSNRYWSRGWRTVFHIQKQSKEDQGLYLISCTSRCIPNHLGKDWWL